MTFSWSENKHVVKNNREQLFFEQARACTEKLCLVENRKGLYVHQ
jgi:hypothetical protein